MRYLPRFLRTSGNAYALLAVHRATALAVANGCAASGNGNGGGDPRWLHRARQFAAFTHSAEGRSVYDTPDRYGTVPWPVSCPLHRRA